MVSRYSDVEARFYVRRHGQTMFCLDIAHAEDALDVRMGLVTLRRLFAAGFTYHDALDFSRGRQTLAKACEVFREAPPYEYQDEDEWGFVLYSGAVRPM